MKQSIIFKTTLPANGMEYYYSLPGIGEDFLCLILSRFSSKRI